MTELWETLSVTASVGTSRQPLTLNATQPALDHLLAQLDPTDREATLLQAAAIVSLWQQAGTAAPSVPDPPPTAPPEQQPYCSAEACSHLRHVLANTENGRIIEWLSLIAAAGLSVPPSHLVALLEAGTHDHALQPLIEPVIGERGRWLAAQHPTWQQTVRRADPTLWETGDQTTRRAIFAQLRQNDPTAARELLTARWPEETYQDRAAFLASCAIGLDPTDEPLLILGLADRRKEVRTIAIDLLLGLPTSQLAQTAWTLVQPLLTFTPGHPGSILPPVRKRKPKLEITLPDLTPPQLTQLGIDRRPPSKTGEKTFWLEQLLERVPPAWITQAWKTTPTIILETAALTDWATSLRSAWQAAALRSGDIAWATALIRDWFHQHKKDPGYIEAIIADLLMILPPPQRETLLLETLQHTQHEHHIIAVRLATHWQTTWSRTLSNAIMTAIYIGFSEKHSRGAWELCSLLIYTAQFLDPFIPLAATWPSRATDWSYWDDTLARFEEALAFRRAMHTAITTK